MKQKQKEFQISFIEDFQEFSNSEMGVILGGNTSVYDADCPCKCTIRFGGTNCGCNIINPKTTYDSCPCPTQK